MYRSGPHLRQGRWYTPLALAIFFGFFSLAGLLWGLVVRTPHPQMNSIAVLPGAFDIATPTRKPVGLASPTIEEINSTLEGLLNYQFRTADSPDKVVTYYRELMLSHYGFRSWQLEEPSPGVQVLHFERETTFRLSQDIPRHGGWDKEQVMVTIMQEDAGTTRVEVHKDVILFVK